MANIDYKNREQKQELLLKICVPKQELGNEKIGDSLSGAGQNLAPPLTKRGINVL